MAPCADNQLIMLPNDIIWKPVQIMGESEEGMQTASYRYHQVSMEGIGVFIGSI